jgi:hypothetical protein
LEDAPVNAGAVTRDTATQREGKTMNRIARNALAILACLPALAAHAAGNDAIWGRQQPDGSVSLTNTPDAQDYQVVVPGSGATGASSDASVKPSTPAPQRQAAGAPAAGVPPPVASDAPASPPSEPQQTLPSRDSIQDAAAAAARTAAQSPEQTQAAAAAVAGQAAQDIANAGSVADRLKALYQAAQGAYSRGSSNAH